MAKLKTCVLVINSGSSSLKFKIFDQHFNVVCQGLVEKIGLKGSFINLEESYKTKRMIMKNFPEGIDDHYQAFKLLTPYLKHWKKRIRIIGHRVVHGGPRYYQPTLISKKIFADLKKINYLAPLHNPINIACIQACFDFFPGIKNAAAFDTGFYQNIPDYAYTYPIPFELLDKYQIRQYGFHGLSHEYVFKQALMKIKKSPRRLKIISCHLGSGSSITAINQGQAIENSMGLTPLQGLMMSTRSGDIDPSIIFYLVRKFKIDINEVERILNNESGLKGIFGYTKDLRDIMIAAGYKIPGYKTPKKFKLKEKQRAQLAIRMFIYRVVKYIGSYATVMGGLDYLIFTGGIGERNADIRKLITKDLRKSWKKFKVLTIPTNEELMIAQKIQPLNQADA
ncbi:MAG: acetate/propionate family kinase [Patescibacteria group bacterium]|jgi:acetate kinase|nr:acetate/propionate family kinase [Patescibacteria group bacterium]